MITLATMVSRFVNIPCTTAKFRILKIDIRSPGNCEIKRSSVVIKPSLPNRITIRRMQMLPREADTPASIDRGISFPFMSQISRLRDRFRVK